MIGRTTHFAPTPATLLWQVSEVLSLKGAARQNQTPAGSPGR
jgi:hypothetical protein